MPDRQTEWMVPFGRGLRGDPPPDQRIDRGIQDVYVIPSFRGKQGQSNPTSCLLSLPLFDHP